MYKISYPIHCCSYSSLCIYQVTESLVASVSLKAQSMTLPEVLSFVAFGFLKTISSLILICILFDSSEVYC